MRLRPLIDGIAELCMQLCLPTHNKISRFLCADGSRRIFFTGKGICPQATGHYTEYK